MQQRHIQQQITGINTSDGAGVKLNRLIAQPSLRYLDPFLLFDEFNSDEASDYIAGFPEHPHRGFQTVTYMLQGKMEHKDSLGNRGVVQSGGIQWMNAGRGIVHSEMPLQTQGKMRGFQLWVNLPSAQKMSAPDYQDISPDAVPVVRHHGVSVKVLAGEFLDVVGPVHGGATEPLFLDVSTEQPAPLCLPIASSKNAFVYCIDGKIEIQGRLIQTGELAVLSDGNALTLKLKTNSRCLLVAGRPCGEPIVQYGPIVMNTQEEIEQALSELKTGRFIQS